MPTSFVTVFVSCCKELCGCFALLFINSQLIPPSLIFFPFSSSPFPKLSNTFVPSLLHVHPCYGCAAPVRHALLLRHQMGLWHIFLGGGVRSTLSELSCAGNRDRPEQLLLPNCCFSGRAGGLPQRYLVLCEDCTLFPRGAFKRCPVIHVHVATDGHWLIRSH